MYISEWICFQLDELKTETNTKFLEASTDADTIHTADSDAYNLFDDEKNAEAEKLPLNDPEFMFVNTAPPSLCPVPVNKFAASAIPIVFAETNGDKHLNVCELFPVPVMFYWI